MPRRRRVVEREILPDPKYKSILVAKFVNCLMKRGEKGISEKIFYDSINLIQQEAKKDGIEVFKKAIDNVQPVLEVKSRRVGGATYQVPVEVRSKRKAALAIRWIISYARGRHGKSMTEKLAAELIDASNNTGGSIKKKEDTHKMAEANKAFAHFRW